MMCVARPIPNAIAKKQNMALVPRLRREYEVRPILFGLYAKHWWLNQQCYKKGFREEPFRGALAYWRGIIRYLE